MSMKTNLFSLKKLSKFFRKSFVVFTVLSVVFGSLGSGIFAPTAYAATSVVLSNGSINANFPGAPIKASSAATAIAKVAVTASAASKTITSVQVNFSGTGFATSDL